MEVWACACCSDWRDIITWPQEETGSPIAFTQDGQSLYVQARPQPVLLRPSRDLFDEQDDPFGAAVEHLPYGYHLHAFQSYKGNAVRTGVSDEAQCHCAFDTILIYIHLRPGGLSHAVTLPTLRRVPWAATRRGW